MKEGLHKLIKIGVFAMVFMLIHALLNDLPIWALLLHFLSGLVMALAFNNALKLGKCPVCLVTVIHMGWNSLALLLPVIGSLIDQKMQVESAGLIVFIVCSMTVLISMGIYVSRAVKRYTPQINNSALSPQ
jgi:hypothetical protein